jgi:segregation and condensation protein B
MMMKKKSKKNQEETVVEATLEAAPETALENAPVETAEATTTDEAILETSEIIVTQELVDHETVVANAVEVPADGETAALEGVSNKITNLDEIEQVLESVIFASTRPISTLRLKNLLNKHNYDVDSLGDVLSALEQKYENRGFQLVKVAGGYQFRTHMKNADVLENLLEDKPARLSQSALEVLAIVAYKQPVTRSEIDAVRGIDSGHLMKGLLEKNLVRTMGHAETPGRPMIYGTTAYFQEVFTLGSLDDLPAVEEFTRELAPADAEGGEQPSVLAAEPDRGAFDAPAEERFEDADFGAPSENAAPPAQA